MGDYNKIEGVREVPLPPASESTPEHLRSVLDKLGGKLRLRSRVRNSTKAKYEDWLENRARRRVFDQRRSLSPQEYKESKQAVVEAVAAGTLSWGGNAWESSLQQMPGLVKMVQLLAEDAGEKVTEEDVFSLVSLCPEVGLEDAVRDALGAMPNFSLPPTRGQTTEPSQNACGPCCGT